jgi:multiple sugar transport system permease protein
MRPGRPFVGLENFGNILKADELAQSVRVTIVYVSSVTALSFALGLGLALVLTEELKGRNVFRTLIALPVVIPPVVCGYAWKFLLNEKVGVFTAYLLPKLGLKGVTILGNPTLAMIAVIIADVWSRTPLMFLIFLGGLQAIPFELFEAAKMDGAGFWQSFRRITLPMLKPVIFVAVVIRVIEAVNAFDIIFVLTSGGPGTSTQTLPLLGWKVGFHFFDMGQAAALGIVMLVITSGFGTVLARRLVQEGP